VLIEINLQLIKQMNAKSMSTECNGYRLKASIGEGEYGKVFEADNKQGIKFAVKLTPLWKLNNNKKLYGRFDHETYSLLRLTHPNIIEYIESFTKDEYLWIVYEFCNKGSLKSILGTSGPFDELKAIEVTRDICSALCAVQEHGLVHRDVKPDNILFKEDTVKLADFGFCVQEGNATKSLVGSPVYMSVEALQDFNYTIKGDVYSLGVTLFVMLTNQLPFYERDLNSLVAAKVHYNVHNDPRIPNPELKTLLSMMLSPFEYRASPQELLQVINQFVSRLKYDDFKSSKRQGAYHFNQHPNRRPRAANPLHNVFTPFPENLSTLPANLAPQTQLSPLVTDLKPARRTNMTPNPFTRQVSFNNRTMAEPPTHQVDQPNHSMHLNSSHYVAPKLNLKLASKRKGLTVLTSGWNPRPAELHPNAGHPRQPSETN
jgi:serine/threonine protein kinase